MRPYSTVSNNISDSQRCNCSNLFQVKDRISLKVQPSYLKEIRYFPLLLTRIFISNLQSTNVDKTRHSIKTVTRSASAYFFICLRAVHQSVSSVSSSIQCVTTRRKFVHINNQRPHQIKIKIHIGNRISLITLTGRQSLRRR